jgi:hypothetical protein
MKYNDWKRKIWRIASALQICDVICSGFKEMQGGRKLEEHRSLSWSMYVTFLHASSIFDLLDNPSASPRTAASVIEQFSTRNEQNL